MNILMYDSPIKNDLRSHGHNPIVLNYASTIENTEVAIQSCHRVLITWNGDDLTDMFVIGYALALAIPVDIIGPPGIFLGGSPLVTHHLDEGVYINSIRRNALRYEVYMNEEGGLTIVDRDFAGNAKLDSVKFVASFSDKAKAAEYVRNIV